MNTESHGPRRILTIDGGGLLGVLPASFLAELERSLEHPIGEYFDLIVGTSTGGIIAIGLGMGYTAAELQELYESEGAAIFGQVEQGVTAKLVQVGRSARQWLSPKYDSEPLRTALEARLGTRRLGESRQRLVIPAWNPQLRDVHIYKTAHHPRFTRDYKALAIDAALATSAAPTYFVQHTSAEGVGLIDGGSWANNPVAIAVTEAIGVLRWPSDALQVLSLGCLDEHYALSPTSGKGALAGKALNLLMDGQSRGALGMAQLLTGDPHTRRAVYRIEHQAPHGTFALDDASQINTLSGVGYAKAREWAPTLTSIFFDQPAAPFVPHHTLYEVPA